MTYSVWRYCHLILALLSAGFLFILTLTGALLSLEPINHRMSKYSIVANESVNLGEVIERLSTHTKEIISIEKTEESFLSAHVLNQNNQYETIYIDPLTGKKLGDIQKEKTIFHFAKVLHRSLFLKSTGRLIVGISSLFLLLISITGSILLVKRMGSLKRFFSKIKKTRFNEYYHLLFGRLSLFPIVTIALSGCILSLHVFYPLEDDYSVTTKNEIRQKSKTTKNNYDFELFRNTTLHNFKKLDFPFSEYDSDPYVLRTINYEQSINQYTGQVLSQRKISTHSMIIYWSHLIHTGKVNPLWSVILGISSLGIIFFMVTGFSMTRNRLEKKHIFKNVSSKRNSEYIILVGSENGNTTVRAQEFYETLQNQGLKVYITQLNNYRLFPKAKEFIIFTSTYGKGEAPSNAHHFLQLFSKTNQLQKTITYSIVGFGSTYYPDFCKFAIDVHQAFRENSNFKEKIPLHKVNQQSDYEFNKWVKKWKYSTLNQ